MDTIYRGEDDRERRGGEELYSNTPRRFMAMRMKIERLVGLTNIMKNEANRKSASLTKKLVVGQ